MLVDYTRGQLEAALADGGASATKIAAARTWLGALSAEKNSAGVPIAGADFDRVCDRTEGKPKQAVQVDGNLVPATSVRVIVPGLNSER